MSSLRSVASIVLCAAVIVAAPTVSAASGHEDPPSMSPEAMAEMAAWMKLAAPAEHHEHLAAYAGTWHGESKMWMEPGAEPMVNEAHAEAKLIMDGRFLEWNHTGDFGGMPFEGRAIEGYNNGDQRYESIWFDNFGTLMLFFTGSSSDAGKTREMKAEFSDAVAGGVIKYRTEYRWISNDEFTYTAWMDKGDGEHKSMVMHWKRK